MRFEAFELNLKTGELRKGGVKIRLQEQSFQILATLLEQPGKLVTRESLHERLWSGDTFVDFDKSLNIAVSKLRQALGDSADKPRLIETLPRRGYRFIGAVEQLDESGEIVGLPTGSAAQRTISHYRLLEKLGEGGMGVVYKALDTKLNRTVALKFLAPQLTQDPKAKERFQREAQAAAAVDHPNICTVHEIDQAGGQIFIAMAYIEGQSLDKKIATGLMLLDEALDIAIQTAQGLQAAHEKGVVHRDIKSSNLMLTTERQLKILDFGLARLADQSRLTQSTAAVGTPSCMSPEQVQRQPTDHRTDVWSLGVVFYQMITGRVPFEGGQEQAVLLAVVHEEHQPVTALRAGLPLELDRVIGKALAKNPAERYQHMDEMLVDLRGLRRGLGAVRLPAKPARLERALLVIPAAALLLFALLYFRGRTPESPEAPVRRFAFARPGVIVNRSQNFMRHVSISPNGRHIAFTATEGKGSPGKLWVQDLDQEQPRVLEGTEGAAWPFWSPGSDFIGFAVGRELKKAPLRGGEAIRLCQLPPGYFTGVAWRPDGQSIVFSTGHPHTMYEVPGGGGIATPLRGSTEGPTEASAPTFGQPHFLPSEAGSNVLLFSSDTLVVQDIETGRRESLVPGIFPHYSPSGHIVYQEGIASYNLWALPFSLETLRATGEPFPIAHNALAPTVAADGTLVYLDASALTKQRLVWRDRRGEKTGEVGLPQESILSPELSPDGKFLATAAHENSNGDVWVWNLERATRTRLTFHPAYDGGPIWSPDGEQVVFISLRSGNFDIFVRRADGRGDEVTLRATPHFDYAGPWSRDGKYLVCVTADPETGDDIWYLERKEDGGWEPHPFLQTPFNETGAKLSPDGTLIAYVSDESGGFEIYVQPFPVGGRPVTLSSKGGVQPRWSRDGKELFYIEGQTLVAVAVSTSPSFAAGLSTHLFEHPDIRGWHVTQYDVSTDGKRFVLPEAVGGDPVIRVVQNWFTEFKDRRQ